MCSKSNPSQARDFNNWHKQAIYVFPTEFDECDKCHQYTKNPDHKCPLQEDSIRITGDWLVENIYRKPNTNLLRILLGHGDEHIGFTKFSDIPNEFFEGEIVAVTGWQRLENRFNSLIVKKKY